MVISICDYEPAVLRHALAASACGDQVELHVERLVGDSDAEDCVSLRETVATQEEMNSHQGFLEIVFPK
tara:strand:- start:1640 stop:1846 length:207 start_codon:yes stop_codon:yes gene_type:complete